MSNERIGHFSVIPRILLLNSFLACRSTWFPYTWGGILSPKLQILSTFSLCQFDGKLCNNTLLTSSRSTPLHCLLDICNNLDFFGGSAQIFIHHISSSSEGLSSDQPLILDEQSLHFPINVK